jgi:hypothetical protein
MVQKYSMKKIDASKLGSVRKKGVSVDSEVSESSIENLVNSINKMGKHHKGKKIKLDIGL